MDRFIMARNLHRAASSARPKHVATQTRNLLLALAVVLLASGCAPQKELASVRVASGPPLAFEYEPEEAVIRRSKGDLYEVRPGDTLWAIAVVHDVELEELAAWNKIDNPDQILVGQKLVVRYKPPQGVVAVNSVQEITANQRIKVGSSETAVEPPTVDGVPMLRRPEVQIEDAQSPEQVDKEHQERTADGILLPVVPPRSRPNGPMATPGVESGVAQVEPGTTVTLKEESPVSADIPPRKRETDKGEESTASSSQPPLRQAKNNWVMNSQAPQGWLWPTSGRLLSRFGGSESGRKNTGIDIAVAEGTPVQAAADGVVAYADNGLPGYGNLLIVRHGGSYMTAYAHNTELLVQRGENVRAGQKIARAGRSGRVSSPRLHFELRKGITPLNPLTFLPKR